jgi:hypothetical protein
MNLQLQDIVIEELTEMSEWKDLILHFADIGYSRHVTANIIQSWNPMNHFFIAKQTKTKNVIGFTMAIGNYYEKFWDLTTGLSTFYGQYLCGSYVDPVLRGIGVYSKLKDFCLMRVVKCGTPVYQSVWGNRHLFENERNKVTIMENVAARSVSSFHWALNRGFSVCGCSIKHSGPLLLLKI